MRDYVPVEASFQLTLPGFEGGVEDLLRLVSQRKIATSELHVAEVTAQFRTYIDETDTPDLDLTGEFVSASARILAIKSADLLVIECDADDDVMTDFRPRSPELALKEAALLLRTREGIESFVPSTPPFAPNKEIEPRSPRLLVRAWEGLDQRTRSRVKHVAVPAFVKLEAALSSMIRRLKTRGQLSFQRLVRGASRPDAVVHFIAVLELVRRRQATASQDELLGDITVEWVDGGVGAAERAG